MTGEFTGSWRPAVFTRRRHYVPADSPTRPYAQCTLGSGLCGCPGYLEDDVRGGEWQRWKLCQDCLPTWLTPWPPLDYRPTGDVAVVFTELEPLDDWWWRWLGQGGTSPVQGYCVHDTGIDCLWFNSPELAALHRLDLTGRLRRSDEGSLDYLVSLITGSTEQRPHWPDS